MEYDVAAVPCDDYRPESVRRALSEAISAVGGLDWVTPGMKIAIKCNLVGAYAPDTAAAVHPAVARELCSMLTSRGASVVLGDSPGGPFSAAALAGVYSATGMQAVTETRAGLNGDFSQETVDFPDGVRIKSFPITSWLLKADCIIDLCKLKTHGLTGFTCAVKNLFGAVPGTRKTEFHQLNPRLFDFCNMLIDLNELLKPRLVVADAVTGMEGNGPTSGTPRHIGAILAAKNTYAADIAAARLIGLDETAPTIAAAVKRGLCPDRLEKLGVYGDVSGLAVTDFKKQPPRGEAGDKGKPSALDGLAALCFGTGPRVSRAECVGCGTCGSVCTAGAAQIRSGKAVIARNKCIRCFCCQEFCPHGAITLYRPPLARIFGKL